jgi:hypothetical protein
MQRLPRLRGGTTCPQRFIVSLLCSGSLGSARVGRKDSTQAPSGKQTLLTGRTRLENSPLQPLHHLLSSCAPPAERAATDPTHCHHRGGKGAKAFGPTAGGLIIPVAFSAGGWDLAQRPEHAPGEAAPAAGIYEQLNIFGRPTGIRVNVGHGHPLPSAPVGHTWTLADDNRTEC